MKIFKTFLKGLLYVILSPLIIAGFALYTVYSLFVYLYEFIVATIKFFGGSKLTTETKEDLTGAVDLTEVAKHSEMVSTESTQNVASNIENPQLSIWSVQAGVFSSESNAKSHLLKLKAKIEQPIEIINENGRHRVLIGPFKDQKTASEQADLFGSIFNEKFIIFEQK